MPGAPAGCARVTGTVADSQPSERPPAEPDQP
jgi:hypothetical protein